MKGYFPVGARVGIRENSRFYGASRSNPAGVGGEIISVCKRPDYPYEVRWDNGTTNRYPRGHLKREKSERKTAQPNYGLEGIIERVRRKLSSYKGGANGVAAIIREGEPLIPNLQVGPCHAFVRGNGRHSICVVTLIRRHPDNGPYYQPSEEVCKKYYDWLFNRSPYAEWFLTKDVDECWSKWSTVVSSEAPANILQGALICTRHTWEYPRNIDLWASLVEEGVDENLAFVVCMKTSYHGEQVTPSNCMSDHMVVGSRQRLSGVEAFLKGTPLWETEKYRFGGDYRGVQAAWEGEGDVFFNRLEDEFKSYDFIQRASSKVVNPFSKVKEDKGPTKRVSVGKYAEFIKKKIHPLFD